MSKKKFTKAESEAIRWSFAVKDRARLLIDALLPLPCVDYLSSTGSCDEFECPSIDGQIPLCQTKSEIASQLALAIQINRCDPLHPEYKNLSQQVKDLLLKACGLKRGEPSLPPQQAHAKTEDET